MRSFRQIKIVGLRAILIALPLLFGCNGAFQPSNSNSLSTSANSQATNALGPPPAPTPPPTAPGPSGPGNGLCSAATKLGTYVGFPDNSNAQNQAAFAASWNSFSAAMNQAPSLALAYIDETVPFSQWPAQENWQIPSWTASRAPSLAGVIPVIGLPMTIIGNDSLTDLQDLASGKWDQVLNQVFQMWASAGYAAFYLRPGYEMNVSLVTSGNTAQFVLAFQHIATLARAFKGASIQIVWNPNEGGSNSIPVDDYYPGDSFVDVIGLDIYGMPNNPDTIVSNASTGPGDFTLTAAINFAKAHKKPFSLPEAGGGADASFPALLASLIGNAGVYVAFVDFWDIDGGGALEWDQDGALSAAWQGAFATISSASAATIIAGGACQ